MHSLSGKRAQSVRIILPSGGRLGEQDHREALPGGTPRVSQNLNGRIGKTFKSYIFIGLTTNVFVLLWTCVTFRALCFCCEGQQILRLMLLPHIELDQQACSWVFLHDIPSPCRDGISIVSVGLPAPSWATSSSSFRDLADAMDSGSFSVNGRMSLIHPEETKTKERRQRKAVKRG